MGRGGRGGCGQGRHDSTPAPPPSPRLVPAGIHVERTPLEFLVKLQGCIWTRLQLPIAFAKAMSEDNLPMLWLRVYGCGNGAVPVVVEQPGPRLMFLGRGWKSFSRAHNLREGHVLHFKMMVDNLLSVKIYRS
ncbi:l-ascorbate oxidase-like protein [Hordeum vulgare]|nr:l-ascorbate oxidase-like protein [Hordeum vulgare]